MSCIRPGAIAPEALVAYVDEEASDEVGEHVRRCAACAAEATRYAETQARLRRTLGRFDCPSPHEIGEYELGMLGEAERVRIAGHLRDCPRCADELRTLRGFLATEITLPVGPVERLRRLVATLVAPAPQPALGGLRGSGAEAISTYRAGAITVTLTLEPARRPGRRSLVGLVWQEDGGAEAEGGEARLTDAGGTTRVAAVDTLGNFAFDELPRGAYRLEIALAGEAVVIEELAVGE